MDDARKRKIAQLVVGIVVTDDDLDPEEDAFVDRLCARFGIPDHERREVLFPIIDGKRAAEELAQLPAVEQREAFTLLIDAAAADGKVVGEELAFLRSVAKVMRVGEEELEGLLDDALTVRGGDDHGPGA